MRILIIVDPENSVPPRLYGGIERVVDLLAREWTCLGHVVDLLAGAGSKRYGEGKVFTHKAPSVAIHSRIRRKIEFQLLSLRAAQQADLVFNFGRVDYLDSILLKGVPLVQTFENPVDQSQINFLESRTHSKLLLHFISHHQLHPLKLSSPFTVIPNPIDIDLYKPGSGDGNYIAFLGRLSRNKGADIAIKACKLANKNLVIAGPIPKEPGAVSFFETEIKPFLNDDTVKWIGNIDDSSKQQLLGLAEGLIFPIRWDEPFGIVMTEALCCGTPVIATKRASTPDVISDGLTGFLCEPSEPDPLVFAHALQRLKFLDRRNCRFAAENHFNAPMIALNLLNCAKKYLL